MTQSYNTRKRTVTTAQWQTKPVTRSRGGVQKYDTALWVVFSDKYIEESRELLSRADEIPQDGEGGDSMDALSFMDAEYLRKK